MNFSTYSKITFIFLIEALPLNICGMNECKSQVPYIQRDTTVMPAAATELKAQTAPSGLTIADSTIRTAAQTGEFKKSKRQQSYSLLYNLLATLPPEIIDLILDYAHEFQGALLGTITPPGGSYLGTLIPIESEAIACFSKEGIELLNAKTGEQLKRFIYHFEQGDFMLLFNNKLLTLRQPHGVIAFLDSTGKIVRFQIHNQEDSIQALAKVPHSDRFIASATLKEIVIYDVEENTIVNSWPISDLITDKGKEETIILGHPLNVHLLFLTSTILLLVATHGNIHVLDTQNNVILHSIDYTASLCPDVGKEITHTVSLSDDTFTIVIHGGRCDPIVGGCTCPITTVDFFECDCPRGEIIPTPSYVQIINWKTGTVERILEKKQYINSIAKSSKMNIIVLGLQEHGSNPSTIELCDLTTGKPLQCFKAHNQPIINLICADDGRIISSTKDEIKVWE